MFKNVGIFKKLRHTVMTLIGKNKSFGECLANVKSKYCMGELIHSVPGQRIYKSTKYADELVEISLGSSHKKHGSALYLNPLFPDNMPYSTYVSRVKKGSVVAVRPDHHPYSNFRRHEAYLGEVDPLRYAKKTEPGGLSKPKNYYGTTYFCPSINGCKPGKGIFS